MQRTREEAREVREVVLPDPIWDNWDGIERCTECAGEVVEGFCHFCGKEHNYDSDNEGHEETALRSVCTNDEVIISDRLLTPRGTTPLLELGDYSVPSEYLDNEDTYEALLERGATRTMILTFNMDYSDQEGIVAWADSGIFERFSGPGMKDGDLWKIHLGRRIVLEEDDLDGAQFLEDLLDEVLMFPFDLKSNHWETVKVSEYPPIWATRPTMQRDNNAAPNEPVSDDETYYGDGDEDGEEDDVSQEDDNENAARAGDEPVLRYDEYEDSDVDMEDIIDEPSPSRWDPNGDGSDFESPDDDEEDQLDSSDGEDMNAGQAIATDRRVQDNESASETIDESSDSDSDVPGSDWDSQEELSGDEAALEMATEYLKTLRHLNADQ